MSSVEGGVYPGEVYPGQARPGRDPYPPLSPVFEPHRVALQPALALQIDFQDDPLAVSYTQAALASQPYSYYRFPDNATGSFTDSSGNGHSGTYNGTPAFRLASPVTIDANSFALGISPGNELKAAGLAGSANGGDLSTGFTVEFWLYFTAVGTTMSVIWDPSVAAIVSSATWPYLYATNTGGSTFTLNLADPAGTSPLGGYGGFAVPGTYAYSTWYHVALVWAPSSGENTGDWTIYINGTPAASSPNTTGSQPVTTTVNQLQAQWWAGGWGSTYTPTFRVAEYAVYPRPLTGSEVRRHYTATTFAGVPGSLTFTDQTTKLKSVAFGRGRQQELGTVEPGALSAKLKDMSRDLEPDNTASPYYPNVVPGRLVSLSATYATSVYDLFRGYIRSWPVSWEDSFRFNTMNIDAVDALGAMSAWNVSGAFPEETTGQRITALLNAISWPQNMRSIDTGVETVVARTVTFQPIQDELLTTADSENGVFFINESGVATFHDKNHRTTAARSVTSQHVLWEGDRTSPSTKPHLELTVGGVELDRIVNEVTVSWGDNQQVTWSDGVSQNRYGVRATSRSTLLSTSAAALAQAQAIVQANKDPKRRIDRVTLHPLRSDELWPVALGSRIGDRLTVKRSPYIGSAWQIDVFVESIQHQVQEGNWTVTMMLSNAS